LNPKKKHTNKVTVLEVEAVQLVASLLRIHHVFIDDERGAFGIRGDTLADLATRGVSRVSEGGEKDADAYRIGPNLPKRSKSSSGVTL
jgi:hypothetical protein